MAKQYETIDDYIADAPDVAKEPMVRIRSIVHEEAKDVQERMSWQMPTFYLNGNLVHFAAHKKHLGFYPGESGVRVFLDKLSAYHTSKGAIQFPYDTPIPYDLIREIVAFRVKENTK